MTDNFFDQFDGPGSNTETGLSSGSGFGAALGQVPEASPRPVPRHEPAIEVDTTDDARAARGLGRSAYHSGLVDAPDAQPGPEPAGSVEEQIAGDPADPRQPISDLGKRAARGATEVGAAVPEALAIAGDLLEPV